MVTSKAQPCGAASPEREVRAMGLPFPNQRPFMQLLPTTGDILLWGFIEPEPRPYPCPGAADKLRVTPFVVTFSSTCKLDN